MSVEVDIMSPTSDQNAKSLSSRWESKMKTHQLKDNVWRYEAGKTTKEKIYYLLWVKELHWLLNLAKLYGAMKRFHPSTPKISLVHVILLTVFGTILDVGRNYCWINKESPKLTVHLVLITCLLDIALTLKGEILSQSQSFIGVKELKVVAISSTL